MRRNPGRDPDETPGRTPPSRRPPTAVGIATPPPPRRYPGDRRGPTGIERMARGLMSSVAIAGGIALCAVGGAAWAVGPALAAAGANGLLGTITGRSAVSRVRQWRGRRRHARERISKRPKRVA